MTNTLNRPPRLEHGSVDFGRTRISYRVRRSTRRTTVGISVGADGVEVAAPEDLSDVRLAELVLEKAAWIVTKQESFADLLHTPTSPRAFVNGEEVRYLGRQYRLKRVKGAHDVRLYGRFVEVPDVPAPEVREALVAWYVRQAHRHFPERVMLYSRQLGVPCPPVFVRDQRKRWGSCSVRGEVRLNWRLIMAPLSLVDYVVVHELVHLEHPHHGKEFWRRLAQVLPDYDDRQARLALLGTTLTV